MQIHNIALGRIEQMHDKCVLDTKRGGENVMSSLKTCDDLFIWGFPMDELKTQMDTFKLRDLSWVDVILTL